MSRPPSPDPQAGGSRGQPAPGLLGRGLGAPPLLAVAAFVLWALVPGSLVQEALGSRAQGPVLAGEISAPGAQPPRVQPNRALALGTGTPSTPAQRGAKRIKVRAACLYNFIKYAQFPKSAFKSHDKKKLDPIVILIIGKDPFGKVIDDMLRKKKAHGRTFLIRRSRTVPVRIDAHLVYATGLKGKEEALLVKRTLGQPCLLVGDGKAFSNGGGFIRLYEEKGKTRFDIDLARQKDTEIKLDVELLKLAKVVKGKK